MVKNAFKFFEHFFMSIFETAVTHNGLESGEQRVLLPESQQVGGMRRNCHKWVHAIFRFCKGGSKNNTQEDKIEKIKIPEPHDTEMVYNAYKLDKILEMEEYITKEILDTQRQIDSNEKGMKKLRRDDPNSFSRGHNIRDLEEGKEKLTDEKKEITSAIRKIAGEMSKIVEEMSK